MDTKMPKKTYKEYPTGIECTQCQGLCCRRMSAPYHPSQFPHPLTKKVLKHILERKSIVVDWWEGDGTPGYFLRPRVDTDSNPIFNGSWGGQCTNLTPKGCELPYIDRPLGCKALKPSRDRHCKSSYDKYEASISWRPYRKVLYKLGDEA